MAPSPLAGLAAFARDSRGAAALELALGAVALIAVSALSFDLYSRVKADTAVARMAVTMADYVSRDTAPDGDDMEALGEYLYEHELGIPADVVYVVTALHQPAGNPPPAVERLWTDSRIRFGDVGGTNRLALDCPRFDGGNGAVALPADFTMSPGEVLVIAEICAALTREGFLSGRFIAGNIYRLHALPARDPNRQPDPPVYARRGGTPTSAASAARDERGGGVHAPAAPTLAAAARA